MQLRDIMTQPAVSVRPDARIKEVAAVLVDHEVNAVPVVDDSGRLVGIVSEADLLVLDRAAGADGRRGTSATAARPQTVGQVMTQAVYALPDDADATTAARLLLRHRLKSVPVVADGRVVGMVARRDLLRVTARADDALRADLEHRREQGLRALQGLRVEVSDGEVTFRGPASALVRELAESLARSVPGVVAVRWIDPPDLDGGTP